MIKLTIGKYTYSPMRSRQHNPLKHGTKATKKNKLNSKLETCSKKRENKK